MERKKEGMKKRLEESKKKKEFLKLIFKYPNFSKPTLKSGYVIECYDDCFWFDERLDGKTTYSYTFLIEISTGNRGQK